MIQNRLVFLFLVILNVSFLFSQEAKITVENISISVKDDILNGDAKALMSKYHSTIKFDQDLLVKYLSQFQEYTKDSELTYRGFNGFYEQAVDENEIMYNHIWLAPNKMSEFEVVTYFSKENGSWHISQIDFIDHVKTLEDYSFPGGLILEPKEFLPPPPPEHK